MIYLVLILLSIIVVVLFVVLIITKVKDNRHINMLEDSIGNIYNEQENHMLEFKNLFDGKQSLQLEMSDLKRTNEHLQKELNKKSKDWFAGILKSSEWRDKYFKCIKEIEELKEQIYVLSSVPINSGDLTINKVNNTEVRIGYDSTWEVIGLDNGQEFKTYITRRCGESVKGMIDALKKCSTMFELKKLDLHDQIYYD